MKLRRRWVIWAYALLLLAPVVVACVMLNQQIRQDALDRALIASVKRLDAASVTRLLNEGANSNTSDTGKPALSPARLLEQLLARLRHQSLNSEPDGGDPAVLLVLESNPVSAREIEAADTIACRLIQRGADYSSIPTAMQKSGYFMWYGGMLHLAAISGLHRTLRLLLSRGAPIEQRDCYGRTPLMCSIDRADVEAVRALLENGADVSAADEYHRSIAFYATSEPFESSAQTEIVRLLKRFASRMNRQDQTLLSGIHPLVSRSASRPHK